MRPTYSYLTLTLNMVTAMYADMLEQSQDSATESHEQKLYIRHRLNGTREFSIVLVVRQPPYLRLRFWWKTEGAKQVPHSRKQWTFIMADPKLCKSLKLKAGCSCGWSWSRISLLCQLCKVCTHIIHQWQNQWWCLHAGWVWTSNTSNLELDKINRNMKLDDIDQKCNWTDSWFLTYFTIHLSGRNYSIPNKRQ